MDFLSLMKAKPTTSETLVKQASLPVVAKAVLMPDNVPQVARTKASEKLLFLQKVVAYTKSHHVTEEVACSVVSFEVDLFPILSKSGHRGKSQLTYTNFRQWMGQVGRNKDRTPCANNINKLLDKYYLSEYKRPGSDTFWTLFMRAYLNDEQLPTAKAYGITKRTLEGNGIAHMPTLAQVRFFLDKHFNQASQLVSRQGDTWAENRLGGYVHRDWSEIAVGFCWVGDHHVLDMYVKVWNEEKGKFEVKRPWLTAWMDIRSLYFVGFIIGVDSPNSTTILQALAVGYVMSGGYGPQMLYADNGRDFKKMGLALPVEIEGHQHSVVDELGVKACYALPYRGRSKPIERIFKEVAQGFCKTQPTYLGSNPQERPETSSAYEKNPEFAPDIEKIQGEFFDYIMNVYHKTPQSGKIIGLNKAGLARCPADAWAEKQRFGREWASMKEISVAMRVPLLRPRIVSDGYCVRIASDHFRCINMGVALNHYYNKKIMIKGDMFMGIYYAYTVDGRLICELEKVPNVRALCASDDDAQAKLLSEEMAWQRRNIKWAKAVALSATGLPVLVSASEALALNESGAELVKLGEKTSVKGSTHKLQMYEVRSSSELEKIGEVSPIESSEKKDVASSNEEEARRETNTKVSKDLVLKLREMKLAKARGELQN